MHHKSILKSLVIVIIMALFMGCAAQMSGTIKAMDLNPQITSGRFIQKVDAFSVIFDTSQSMDETYKNETKMNQQKRLVSLLDKTIPDLKLTGALRTFGQFITLESSKAVFLDRDYKKPRLMQATAPFTTGYGFSPLDAALDGVAGDLCSQPGRMAVIAFSDGEDMEKHDPVAAAKRMKAAFGDRICIYTVHLGDNAGGKKLMQQVADSGQCGFMVTGDSISTPAGMASFVEKVFQKVDAFSVIFDTSQSMDETYKNETKMNQQKRLVSLLDKTIPDLKLTGALRTFGQFITLESSKAVFLDRDYKKPRLMQATAPFTTGYGFSPLDAALDGVAGDLCSQPGRMAVIAFSDGEDMEKHDPVAAAKRMKAAFGDRICIYTVHLGDNAGGKKLMQQVADSGQCGFMVTGDSISTPAGMASFVEKVFLEKKSTESAKEQVPSLPTAEMTKQADAEKEAAAEIERKILEKGRATLLVTFDFNKAVVKPKYMKEIENITDLMRKYPELNIVVEGHTCNMGPAKYNNKLSQRRAEAIKTIMVNKFKIDSTRIKTKGYGLTKPIASNATREGRQQNRRVEAAAIR